MLSLRSLRNTAPSFTVAGTSCLVATLLLTGCGDDDKGAPPPSDPPSMNMPSLRPLPTPTVPPSLPKSTESADSSANAPTLGAPKPSGAPTSAGGSSLVPRTPLSKGDCINATGKNNMTKVPCTSPHDGEVAATQTLADSVDPSSPTYLNQLSEKCKALLLPIVDRQPNASSLAFTSYGPTVNSWTSAGDRKLDCVMTGKGGAKLTAPLK